MPTRIPVPNTPWSEDTLSLNGVIYTLDFKYNSRDSRWYFTLLDSNSVVIKHSIKIVEGVSLLQRYKFDNFSGDMFCMEVRRTDEVVTRHNLGIGKDYELVYFNQQELEEVGLSL